MQNNLQAPESNFGKVVTPVLIDKLLPFLQGYDNDIVQYLHRGFTEGFHTGFVGENMLMIAPESHTVHKYPGAMEGLLAKSIAAGIVDGPFTDPPHEFFRCSPVSVRPKKTPGKFRRIQDLSWPYDERSINRSIPDDIKTVHYATISDAINTIKCVGPHCWMAKLDIMRAYDNLPVHPTEQHLLGFRVNGLYYFGLVLPQGMGTSCRIFECFSTALEWIIRNKFGVKCHHILDDFLIIAPSFDSCSSALHSILQFFHDMGIPVEPSKTEGPTQCLSFVGIELDTDLMESRLPLDKVQDCFAMLDGFITTNKSTLVAIQRLTGKLCFATSTIPYGRPFLRRLYDLTVGLDKPWYHRRINAETKLDLMMWRQFLVQYNGKGFMCRPVFQHALCSDASSLVGFGAVCGNKWICGQWPKYWHDNKLIYNIDVMEFYAVLACVATFASSLAGHQVFLYSDNLPTVNIIRKLTSKSKNIMPLVRELTLICLQNDIELIPLFIPGLDNILCDKISRNLHTASLLQEYEMENLPTLVPENHLPHSFVLPQTD